MNFGYSDKQQRVVLDEQSEPNRYPMQLYHHLTSEVEIHNRDIIEVGCGRGGGYTISPEISHPLQPGELISISRQSLFATDFII